MRTRYLLSLGAAVLLSVACTGTHKSQPRQNAFADVPAGAVAQSNTAIPPPANTNVPQPGNPAPGNTTNTPQPGSATQPNTALPQPGNATQPNTTLPQPGSSTSPNP